MKWWQEIRRYRTDITDYLIHWTKDLGTLLQILECGYLIPTFAPVYSYFGREKRQTIRGPFPAVCFTEQPLDCFLRACELRLGRYHPYGIVVHKYAVYAYGGRPVLYGDRKMLDALSDSYKYLWVQYNPIPGSDGYPLDFTHEREWRCLVNTETQFGFSDLPKEGVPILLPWDASCNHDRYKFRLIVNTDDDAKMLRQVLPEPPSSFSYSRILNDYLERLPETQIVTLEEIRKLLETGQRSSIRFEDLTTSA